MTIYQIVVTNRLGTFRGEPDTLTEEQLAELDKLLSRISELTYLKIAVRDGVLYFPNTLLQQSVVGLYEIDESVLKERIVAN